MKIDKIKSSLKFYTKNIKAENNFKKTETFCCAQNSLDILANYNMANINFTGRKEPDIEIKSLDSKEFKKYSGIVKAKLSKLKNFKNSNIMVNPYNVFLLDRIVSDERLNKNENLEDYFEDIISSTITKEQVEVRLDAIDSILSIENITDEARNSLNEHIGEIVSNTVSSGSLKVLKCVLSHPEVLDENEHMFIRELGFLLLSAKREKKAQAKVDFLEKALSRKGIYSYIDLLSEVASGIENKKDVNFRMKVLDDMISVDLDDKDIFSRYSAGYEYIYPQIDSEEKFQIASRILHDKRLLNNEDVLEYFSQILFSVNDYPHDEDIIGENIKAKLYIIYEILNDEELSKNKSIEDSLGHIICFTTSFQKANLLIKLIKDTIKEKNTPDNNKLTSFIKRLSEMIYTHGCEEFDYPKFSKYIKDKDLTLNQVLLLIEKMYFASDISIEDIKKLNQKIGFKRAELLTKYDNETAVECFNFIGKNSLSELSLYERKELLDRIIRMNSELFSIGNSDIFPLIPKNQQEYCALLPALVKSISVEVKPLTESQNEEFSKNLIYLAYNLSKLSDSEFNNLQITQEYDKDKFIVDILNNTMDLSEKEKQIVFNYFGFTLKENERAKTGFSILGYPVDCIDESEIYKIDNPKIKEAIKNLKIIVNKFSENNKIKCNNPETEELLNQIIKYLPELHSKIGCIQAGMNGIKGSHEFDVFSHSLKVMQKIVQNPEFIRLNNSDKKIMLIASLLHDIAKLEGYIDHNHPIYGSYDGYCISEKFNLSKKEQIKLYTLIKHHEWLSIVNNSINARQLDNNLKSTAYDLRHDNIFDMSLIFTHADLMAVKKDNSFHDKTTGESRTNFLGETRSFGQSADYYGAKIKELIEELKYSEPILPTSKIPSASRINEAITKVYPDGSTNIKGVYKDKRGLVVIKYNEVKNKDWEKIGFEKDSISKGIKTVTELGDIVNTGNIKFFVHGLDEQTQLINFDAFNSIDSDALLSVSYAERPESKYRFFRPQGIILNSDTKYIHGGGSSDSGSGTKKTIEYIKNYAFEKGETSERNYISNFIKEKLKIDDNIYLRIVQDNINKPFARIYPSQLRDDLIKVLASINSSIRTHNRDYNEFFISNPNPPMAVYAYDKRDMEINNPVDFIIKNNSRLSFLTEYALERDIPFFIFGK